MSLYTKFTSTVLFPLHEKAKSHRSVAMRKELERTQWLDQEQILGLQLKRLKSMLAHCNTHVPYYRSVMQHSGISAADVDSVEQLQDLPFLDKETIRANMDDLCADNASNMKLMNTGGSSGEPLQFYVGVDRISHDVAAKWRATKWWGVDIGDRELVVWGSPIEAGMQDRTRDIRDFIFRTSLLQAFDMSDLSLESYVEKISQYKPRMLFGYPSSLSVIAEHARKNDYNLSNLGIKVVFVTSERLYDHQRAIIESVFGCRVANGYGGRDSGFIAHQCPQGGMHISAEDIIVEITDSEGHVVPSGESGEVVVTHLATRGFPFIRYRTGDVATISKESCACGRGLPILSNIQGRTTDFVVASDGTQMHGLALIYVLRELSDVRQFKIIQESDCMTCVKIVPRDSLTNESKEHIKVGFKKRLGQNVEVRIDVCESIPRDKSGKYRYVVSHLASTR